MTYSDPGGPRGTFDTARVWRVAHALAIGSVAACGDGPVEIQANSRPIAVIEAPSQDTTVKIGTAVTFQGRGDDDDGEVVEHAWAFGDGVSSSLEDPGSYVYAAVGSYAVEYIVTDDGDETSPPARRTVQVIPNRAPTAFISEPGQDTTVTLGMSVIFQGSAADADGSVESHRWEFGDGGTSTVEDPGAYQYGAVGEYSVTYEVTDDDGESSVTATRTVSVVTNQAPTATIEVPASDVTVTVGAFVTFEGAALDSDGTVVTHSWSFGDGGSASVEDPGAYTYGSVGVYAVTYTATDDDGAVSDPAMRTITVVENQAPTASIDAPGQDTTVTLGSAVRFEGSAADPDGSITTYSWDFGDGGGASVEDPGSYTYGATGEYVVSFEVTDDSGETTAAETRTVTIVPGGTNSALRFFGNGSNDIDRVKIRIDDPATVEPGPPVDVGATDFTIEWWMRAFAAENTASAVVCGDNMNWIRGNIIIDRDRFGQDRRYGISIAGGALVVGMHGDGTGDLTLCGATRVDDGEWHHIAVTRTLATGALQIFVDGQLDASAATGPAGDISYPDDGIPRDRCGGPCDNSDPFVVLGAEKHDASRTSPSYSGWLDELRYSTVIRYTGPFTPPTSAFVPDAATAALYHFDEGGGDTIGDSSGAAGGPSNGVRRFGGSPAGPLWVPSGAPTGNE